MSNSTQNDWEKEVESLFYLIFNQDKFPSLRGTYDDYLKFKEDTIKIVKVSFGKLLADARREVMMEVKEAISKLKIVTPKREPPKNKLTQNQIFASGQMNMLVRLNDVLATLREEES